MRTTITIDDNLLRKAKIIAAKKGATLKTVVEEGLREVIRLDSMLPTVPWVLLRFLQGNSS